jgi:hypothetical protein
MELPAIPFEPRNILVAPLNWGLGHATRSADVVMRLSKQYPNAKIILGSDGASAEWLRQKFPDLTLVTLPGYRIRYGKGSSLVPRIAFQSPRIVLSILREYRTVRRLRFAHGLDLIISDNRYGVWSRGCYSVFITHQLSMQSPGRLFRPAFRFLNQLNRFWIGRYQQCWVPDFEESPGMAGALSHPQFTLHNIKYIGPLSRFRWIKATHGMQELPELLCIVSGPEPQRGIFLELLLHQLQNLMVKTVIVAGNPGSTETFQTLPHVKVYQHLPDEAMLELIQGCKVLVSRSGYSTIMDLHFAGRKAVFVPTPGQTEQEYLAMMYGTAGLAQCFAQQEFDLGMILHAAEK